MPFSFSTDLNVLIAIALLSWSSWGLFDKKALEGAGHLDVLLFQHAYYLLEVPLGWLILNWLYQGGWTVAPGVWLWTGFASMSSSGGMLFYLIAMSKAEASFVLGITAAYPLIVQVLAHIFLHDALVPERMIGSLLVGIGVTLVGSSVNSKNSSQKHYKTVLLTCFMATLLWGVTGLFDKKALAIDLPFKIYYARCVWDAAILAVMLVSFKIINYKVAYKSAKAWKYSGFSSICLSLGTLSYLFAMTMATASYVIVITGCYPLLMYLGAVIFLKEKLSKLRLAGVMLIVAGGLLVQKTQAL
ncbi:hypothetical protein BH11CYA1_BH11CYA1_34410 [soil metagenome]